MSADNEQTRTTGFDFRNVEAENLTVAWNGLADAESAYIDIDIHDDAQPEDETTVVGRITLTVDEAEKHANEILAAVALARTGHAAEIAKLNFGIV